MSRDTRPDRHALLELDALLDQITLLRDEGDAARFDKRPGPVRFPGRAHGRKVAVRLF